MNAVRAYYLNMGLEQMLEYWSDAHTDEGDYSECISINKVPGADFRSLRRMLYSQPRKRARLHQLQSGKSSKLPCEQPPFLPLNTRC